MWTPHVVLTRFTSRLPLSLSHLQPRGGEGDQRRQARRARRFARRLEGVHIAEQSPLQRGWRSGALMSVEVKSVAADVCLGSLWCPPPGVHVTEEGSLFVQEPSVMASLTPSDLSTSVLGSVVTSADIMQYARQLERVQTLGRCTLPKVHTVVHGRRAAAMSHFAPSLLRSCPGLAFAGCLDAELGCPLAPDGDGAADAAASGSGGVSAGDSVFGIMACSTPLNSSANTPTAAQDSGGSGGGTATPQHSGVEKPMRLARRGLAYILQRSYVRAQECVLAATDAASSVNSVALQAYTLFCLGVLTGAQGDYASSVAVLHRSADMFREAGLSLWRCYALRGAIIGALVSGSAADAAADAADAAACLSDPRACAEVVAWFDGICAAQVRRNVDEVTALYEALLMAHLSFSGRAGAEPQSGSAAFGGGDTSHHAATSGRGDGSRVVLLPRLSMLLFSSVSAAATQFEMRIRRFALPFFSGKHVSLWSTALVCQLDAELHHTVVCARRCR